MKGWGWTVLLGLALALQAKAAPPSSAAKAPVTGSVTVLRSEPTFRQLGWRSRWEWRGAVDALQSLGLKVHTLDSTVLEKQGCPTPLLILPNSRNMDLKTVQAVQRHLEKGGKLLATYQSSYRKADNGSWNPNNFALSRQLGVRFKRWVGTPPDAAFLLPEPASGIPAAVGLSRNLAMIVDPLEGTTILARWDRPENSPAIVQNGRAAIYAGEDLLAPELTQSRQVRELVASLLVRLDPELRPDPARPGPAWKSPPVPYVALPVAAAGSQAVKVGLGTLPKDLRLRVSAYRGGVRLTPGARAGGAGAATRDSKPVPRKPAAPKLPAEVYVDWREGAELMLEGAGYLNVRFEHPNGTVRWSAYRGRLNVRCEPEGLTLINELPLDAYLAGVVPSEVPASFPEESLKAMAVVARTYSLSHLGRHKGFDVCSEVHCQVYRGLAQEAASTTQAVVQTANEILTFSGRPADATFSACCGGHGVNVETAWPKSAPIPYLTGTPDTDADPGNLAEEANLRQFLEAPPPSYCQAAGRFRWEETYAWKDFQDKLQQSLPVLLGPGYVPIGEIQNVTVTERAKSGHVRALVVQGSAGNCTVGNDSVRWLTSGGKIGAGGLNSSLFYLERLENDRVRVRGGGWGHGVGLCQEGAAGRARAGHDYRAIMQHYYPGTQFSALDAPVPTMVLP